MLMCYKCITLKMKLLICTQALDTNHPILGFFHNWVLEFSKHCEEVHVVCLQKGNYDLPENVFVYSLGKENKEGRLTYLLRFYSTIWKLRNRYDNVFVHMNQIYAILGFPLWKVYGKKVGLWYMHKSVTRSLKIAEKLVSVIFTGSPESFRLPSKKVFVTGHGIDTDRFVRQEVQKDIDLITVGRLSRSKNIHAVIDIFIDVQKQLPSVNLSIVGGAVSDDEKAYEAELKQYVEDKHLSEAVHFVGSITQSELPMYLSRAKVFVHTALNGSLDKATLEPLSIGLPLISMAEGTSSLPLAKWHVQDHAAFVAEVILVLETDTSVHTAFLKEYVQKEHSMKALIPKILSKY